MTNHHSTAIRWSQNYHSVIVKLRDCHSAVLVVWGTTARPAVGRVLPTRTRTRTPTRTQLRTILCVHYVHLTINTESTKLRSTPLDGVSVFQQMARVEATQPHTAENVADIEKSIN